MNESTCFFCGQEIKAGCIDCGSRKVESGWLDFVWNGLCAKRVQVLWCRKCDATWIEDSMLRRFAVCTDCRDRALRVDQGAEEPRAHAA